MRSWILKLILLLVLCLFYLLPYAQSSNLPPPVLIKDRQGLPQGFISGLVQDQQGFLWFGTRDGLCRYDGTQFKVFQLEAKGKPSISDLRILHQDEQGRLWITSEPAHIALFDPRTETFTDLSRLVFGQRPLDMIFIQRVYTDRQQRLWIA